MNRGDIVCADLETREALSGVLLAVMRAVMPQAGDEKGRGRPSHSKNLRDLSEAYDRLADCCLKTR